MVRALLRAVERVERAWARALLAAAADLLGPRAATRCFAAGPVRRTRARALWLQARIHARQGREAAVAMATDYLARRPPPQHYRPLLCETGPCRPTAEEIAAALPRLIAGAGRRGDALQALAIALIERGEARLAADAIAAARATGGGEPPAELRAIFQRRLAAPPPAAEGEPDSADVAPPPCDSRLLLTDGALPPGIVAHLARGARRLTVMRFGELYGRVEFEEVRALAGGVEIAVEHARSRTGRFGARYHALHRATLAAAEEIVAAVCAAAPWLEDLRATAPDMRQILVLDLADALFFKALRMDGALRALRDPAFDDVQIAFGENYELFRLAFVDPSLARDPRVRASCWSPSPRTRRRFESRLEVMRERMAAEAGPPVLDALRAIEPDRLGADAIRVARWLGQLAAPVPRPGPADDRPRVAFVISGNAAYLDGAAQIALRLGRRFAIDLVWTHARTAPLRAALARARAALADADAPSPAVIATPDARPDAAVLSAFQRLVLAALREVGPALLARAGDDLALRCALDCALSRDVAATLLQTLARLRRAQPLLRFGGYRAVALCPVREPRNAVFIPAARQVGLPSLAIETHCLNAAYCRYGSVATDYAALPATHFAEEYERDFGIPRARAFVTGSPRLLRPEGYESGPARAAARAALGLGPDDPPVILLLTQPMPETHAARLCRMAVRATMRLDRPARLLIKPHPEENDADCARHRAIVAEEGAGERCAVVGGDVKALITASRLVLVYYSVTALEAAILERNVAVLGGPGVVYPMPYHRILGVPFCVDEDETRAAIADALERDAAAASSTARFRQAHPYLYDNGVFDRLGAALATIVDRGAAGIRPAEELPASPFVAADFREYLA